MSSSSQLGEGYAIPFIVYDPKLGFCLTSEAESYLSSLGDDRKVGVISIVGKYRTGKSFFVNRVLLDNEKSSPGFQVGPTINPCTKGLWLWRRVIKSSEDDNMDILLVDTEGFGGMDEDVNHDSRIFLFSLLLSSYFIYNSQGSIDENALNSLSLIINLAKDIKTTAANNKSDSHDDPANHFPSFLWVVRDFALQIVDALGNELSSKEYLERALELQKGVSDAVESKNRIRKLMKHFFKERDCATLVRPVESERDLQRLNEVGNEDLRPEFLEEITALKKKIFKRVRAKTLGGRALNGRMLVEMCKSYIQAINKGSLPNIENAWTYVKKGETIKGFEKAKERINELIFDNSQRALDTSEMELLSETLKREVIKIMKQYQIGDDSDSEEYQKRLENEIAEKIIDLRKLNKTLLKRKYAEACNEMVAFIERKLFSEEYSDFFEFSEDLEKIKQQLETTSTSTKDPKMLKYFTEISEKLYKLAADKIGAKRDRDQRGIVRQAELRLEMRESELSRQKEEYEREREETQGKLTAMTEEICRLKKAEEQREARQRESVDKIERIMRNHADFQKQVHEEVSSKDRETAKRIRELEQSSEAARNEMMRRQANAEKQVALMEQEKSFIERENKTLAEKVSQLEIENKKVRMESIQHLTTIEVQQGPNEQSLTNSFLATKV